MQDEKSKQTTPTQTQTNNVQSQKYISLWPSDTLFEKDQCFNWLSNTKGQVKQFLIVVYETLPVVSNAASYRVEQMLLPVSRYHTALERWIM